MKYEIPRTCVDPSGAYICALHKKPSFRVKNYRETNSLAILGHDQEGRSVNNQANFPQGDVEINNADGVYEIPNAFPFWGATYILFAQAGQFSEDPEQFKFRKLDEGLDKPSSLLKDLLKGRLKDSNEKTYSLKDLPRTLLLSLSQTSRDPEILKAIAHLACKFELDRNNDPVGVKYEPDELNQLKPAFLDHDLFEVLGNNEALPDNYKLVMVLAPGIQGDSQVVGEYTSGPQTHIWEYLRADSYIPWGHYASNMAHDCVKYKVRELLPKDITGLRRLYYQRVYTQMALNLNIDQGIVLKEMNALSDHELEALRRAVIKEVSKRRNKNEKLPFTATLWGWNYGFDFSPSGYRLHASHQQIHHQFALIPPYVKCVDMDDFLSRSIQTYAVGDQVAHFAALYKKAYGQPFFKAYLRAIRTNKRLDNKKGLPSNLVVYEDKNVMIHVPKAQRSQGEVQIMTIHPIGNVLEAGSDVRSSLDRCIRLAIRTMNRLGAQMVTCYEVSKRFDNPCMDQRLFYCLLPRHAHSPGAFSERQERWVTGHFPEDYAETFRRAMESVQAD